MDVPLNEEGLRQAREFLALLPDDVGVVYSSPLSRAKQTADIIATHLGLPIRLAHELAERDLGLLSGKLIADIEGEFGKSWEELRSGDFDPVHEVEHREAIALRVKKFIEETKLKHDSPVLAVTHAGVIRATYRILDMDAPDVQNVSIHKFDI